MLADVRRLRREVHLIVGAFPVCIFPPREYPADLLYPRRLRLLHLWCRETLRRREPRPINSEYFLGCAALRDGRSGAKVPNSFGKSAKPTLSRPHSVKKSTRSPLTGPPLLIGYQYPVHQGGVGFAFRVKALVGLSPGGR